MNVISLFQVIVGFSQHEYQDDVTRTWILLDFHFKCN